MRRSSGNVAQIRRRRRSCSQILHGLRETSIEETAGRDQTPFEETAGQFSPDGRWIADQSNESGRVEIYGRSFPGPGGQRQVSTGGGSQARWRPDGKELFYIAPVGRMMAAPIAVGVDGQTLEPGAPVALFPTRLALETLALGASRKQQYAVASDGRFLMNVVETTDAAPITVVLNWQAALTK